MKQNNYNYTVVFDKDRNILGLLVRYENKEAVFIPLIDIFLMTERIM